jgi:hypothetical protein
VSLRLVAAVFALLVATTAAGQEAAAPAVTVEVRFEGGPALDGVAVFALDRRTGELVAAGRSDGHGEVTLSLVARGSQGVVLGVTTSRFELLRFEGLAPDRFRAVMAAVPQAFRVLDPALAENHASPALRAPPEAGPTLTVPLGVLRASVADETGVALTGVRVSAYEDGTRVLATTTLTDPAGHAVLVLPPGRFRLHAAAPGLVPLRYQGGKRSTEIVMTVDTQVETVRITEGVNVLHFRLDDSVDPEFYPPPQARAWLKAQYCLDVDRMFRRANTLHHLPGPAPVRRSGPRTPFDDPGTRQTTRDVPISYAARQLRLERYWWLKKLYTEPPGVCHHHRRFPRPLLPW